MEFQGFISMNMIFSKESIPYLFRFTQIWSLPLENNRSLEILDPCAVKHMSCYTLYNLEYWSSNTFNEFRQNELKSPVNLSKRIKFNSFSIPLSGIESFVKPSPINDVHRFFPNLSFIWHISYQRKPSSSIVLKYSWHLAVYWTFFFNI